MRKQCARVGNRTNRDHVDRQVRAQNHRRGPRPSVEGRVAEFFANQPGPSPAPTQALKDVGSAKRHRPDWRRQRCREARNSGSKRVPELAQRGTAAIYILGRAPQPDSTSKKSRNLIGVLEWPTPRRHRNHRVGSEHKPRRDQENRRLAGRLGPRGRRRQRWQWRVGAERARPQVVAKVSELNRTSWPHVLGIATAPVASPKHQGTAAKRTRPAASPPASATKAYCQGSSNAGGEGHRRKDPGADPAKTPARPGQTDGYRGLRPRVGLSTDQSETGNRLAPRSVTWTVPVRKR